MDSPSFIQNRESWYAKNDMLLIQTFLNSLIGLATTWFADLDKTKISSCERSFQCFHNSYKFNIKLPPDRFNLKENEAWGDFCEYSQHWRAKPTEFQPPLSKRE